MLPRSQLLLVLTAVSMLVSSARAEPRALEVIGTAHANNRAGSLVFRIAPHQSQVSEIRIRSGSLAVTLESIEIEFADGRLARISGQETLLPGHQSRPVRVDSTRAIAKVFVTLQPGLRPGETVLQLLGKIER